MGWGNSANVVTTNLDAGTDSPATARSDLKTALDELTNVIDGRGTADGCASLDSTGRIPFAQNQYNIGTVFPTITDEAYGYRFFRTDLGEWFTLMDATVWGGTGKAWVGDQAETWAYGTNKTTTVTGTYALGTFGNAQPTSATVGILSDVDHLITAAKFANDQSVTATVKVMVGGSAVLTLSPSSELTKSLARGASNWVRVSAGDVLGGELTLTGGTMDDPVFSGIMRRVIDAT